MDAAALEKALESWVRVETWHKFHPLDEKRFHTALRAAFESVGSSITKEDFETAILALAGKYHSNDLPAKRTKDSEYWSQRAEHIASYVQDTGGI
mgnify:CR=1 FL=1